MTVTEYTRTVAAYLIGNRETLNCLVTCIAYSYDKDQAAHKVHAIFQRVDLTHTPCGKRITRTQIRYAMRLI